MTLEEILSTSIRSHATDVHIEQNDNGINVLQRHLGRISLLTHLDASNSIINRVKMRANLDLSETRRTQEGQFSFTDNQQDTFIRVSIIPTVKGEKVALRLLPEKIRFDITNIGMPAPLLKALIQALNKGSGLILVCGATGAGKSTTLYSCLDYLNKQQEKTIFTIEDPVEHEIPHIFQCEPNLALGMDSARLLKSFLRQDPDIIMVGEIRDAQTANLALNAALTGHLVLATLHTNSALDAIHRCHNWNVDFFSLVSSLNLIIHQTMTYQENSQCALFTGLTPTWTETLPLDYKALISTPRLWSAFHSSENTNHDSHIISKEQESDADALV